MLPYHFAQLAAFCKAHPIQPKVLFVPSPQVGYNLTTALAGAGQAWANLHITTPAAWAERTVGPALQAAGWRPLLHDVDLFFLEGLMARTVRREPDGYFPRQSMSFGLARSFLRTLHALRIAGVKPGVLEKTDIEPRKIGALSALYQEYCTLLKAERYYDNAMRFEQAMERLVQEQRGASDTIYAILDETPLPGLTFHYVKALAGDTLYRIGRPDYGIAPPTHSAAARFPDASFPNAEAIHIGAGGKLLSEELSAEDSDALSPKAEAHKERLRLSESLGSENEVRGILREILRDDIPLDAVEIAYTTESPYLTLLYDAAERFELPVAFAAGIPVMLTRPGQALAGFYRWIGSRFEASELIGLCRAGLLTFNRMMAPGETLEPYQAALFLTKGRIGRGRTRYAAVFDRLQSNLQERLNVLQEEGKQKGKPAEQLEAEHACLLSVRRVLDKLFSLVPEETRTSVQTITEASIQFLRQFVPIRSMRDRIAQESLVDRLKEIGANVELEDALLQVVQRLSELMKQHKVEASVAKPGHLYGVPLERAGYNNRQFLYVLGMDEGSFPGGAAEDPILLDDERTRLSDELELHRTKPGEQVWHLVRMLGMASSTVTLLSNRRSLADGRETYPCALFQQAKTQLAAEAPPVMLPIPSTPDLALDNVEAMLAVHGSAGFDDAVRASFRWLVDGEAAEQVRAQPALTRFDGWLGRKTPDLDIAKGRAVLSASRLETLASCPYRYFLNYVLRVEPLDELVEDPTRWLSPLEFGLLLHDLFRDFMEKLREQGERPDQARHSDLLNRMLQQEIAKYREFTPVLHEAAYRADTKRLQRAAQIFLAVESQRQDVEPIGFEVSFGFGETGSLNRDSPVPVRLSERMQFLLQGRIDRIDRVQGDYEIWDYKTGSMSQYDEQDLLKKGTHLQWALYAYALEYILEERGHPGCVRKSGYFFTSDREHGRRISAVPPEPAALAGMLAPLFDLAAQGCFFHVQKEDQCTYCDYHRLCATEQRLPKHMPDINAAISHQLDIIHSLNRWMNA